MSTTTAPAAPAEPAKPAVATSLLAVMLGTSAAVVLLAVYQWMELIALSRGIAPTCNINETLNCGAVWNSAFAHVVHDHLGIPVAGLGIVWGVTGFGLSMRAMMRQMKGVALGPALAPLRLWGLLGAFSCVTFAVASYQAHALCVTCLGTYVLTLSFFAATALIPGEKIPSFTDLMPGLPVLLILLGASYGAVLYPGMHTPKPAEPTALAPGDDQLQKYFDTIPEQEKLATAYARAQYLQAQPVKLHPAHFVEGNPDAPVKIIEWTDIKCPHCAKLLHDLDDISRAQGASFSLEPRYFPLDGECNPGMQNTAGDGVRCLGAKIEICLENRPGFKQAQLALFDNQANLTPSLMMQIAERAMPKAELDQCIAAPATAQRLQEDLVYAMETHPDGTPIVLVNGKPTLAVRSFIYGMVMSKGDPNAKLFSSLPPPPTPQ